MEADVLGTDVWAWKTFVKSPQFFWGAQELWILYNRYFYLPGRKDILRRHPDQAMAWADAICHQHGRNNYARILFVVTQLFGKPPMLKVW